MPERAEHRCGLTAAADDHTSGGMIALMPTPEDAARLAVPGGEPAEELHLTLYYLGDDGFVFTPEERTALLDELRMLTRDLPSVTSNIFGIAHWNAGSDNPSWVWSVGDPPDGVSLGAAHEMAEEGVWATGLTVPDQHRPWVAHICAAYTDDLSLAPELEQRLGPVTFDRIRVSFGDDDTDIPLTGDAVTASAGPLRRDPTERELAARTDFAGAHHQWEAATARAVSALASVTAAWRLELRQQITQRLAAEDPESLPDLTLPTGAASGVLLSLMEEYAVQAGRACQREAETQGVRVPEWHIPSGEDAVTAGLGGRKLLRSVADFTSDLIAGSMLQAAKRRLSGMLRSRARPEAVAGEIDQDLADDEPGMRGAVGSAMTAAQNAGRLAVFEAAPEASLYVASEIMDRRTCGPCRQVDGREFDNLEDAVDYYPVMGFRDCSGAAHGNACRGMLIALWQQVSDADEPSDVTASADNRRAAYGAAEGSDSVTTATDNEAQMAAEQCPPGMEPGPDGECVKMQAAGETEELRRGEPNPGTKKDKRLKENKSAGEAEALAHGAAADADVVEGPSVSEIGAQTAPWRGPLAPEGIETGDGREFEPESLTWADPPLPLRWNKEDSHGGEPHTVAVNVGRIDRIWRDEGGLIMGEGLLDLSTEDGRVAHSKVKNQMLRGVSVDVDSIKDADMELVWPTDPDADGEGDPFAQLFASPEKVVFHKGRIRAATLVDIPAFAEAYIALLDDSGAVVAGGEPIGAVRETRVPRARVASVEAPVRPPKEWFADPHLSVPTGITVTPEGRVYGHAALWGTCHIGQAGVCVTPPQEEAHPYFMTGNVWTEDGASVSVGQITVGTGHAPLSYGYRAASDHYDNTGAAVADVAVGNDGHGIWVAGSIRPGTDESRIRELRAAGQVSGDWRRIGGSLRLVGLLAVNVPGFPVPKLKTHLTSGQQLALVAAGIPQLHDGLSEAELDQWAYRRVIKSLSAKVHREE
jgi:2'-5' RNA ligase